MYFNKNEKQHLIVIGGNVSGLAAASQARRNAPDIDITVLESGQHISYGTCGLPYFISGIVDDINKLFVYSPQFFEEKRKIKILTGHKVTAINLHEKKLTVNINNSAENIFFDYDKLIICSGARPVNLKIDGLEDSCNVFHFRNVADTLSLKNYINKNKPLKAAIIGGGSIGLLIAEALMKIGIKTVVIEKSKRIFKDFEQEISNALFRKVVEKGCNVLTNSFVSSVKKNDSNIVTELMVENTEMPSSEKLDTDVIVLTAGIAANTSFIEGTSIELGCNQGIKTSSRLQTNYSNIFAAGDCCCVKNIVTGKPDYIPTANNAGRMGRIAGGNATGGDEIFNGSVGTKVDVVFDHEVAKTGISFNEALNLGFNPVKITDTYPAHAVAIPGVSDIEIVLIADYPSGKILGAQMIGKKGVAKRIDIFATALTCGMTINDVYNLDLGYSPTTSTVWDPVNKICGKAMLNFEKRKF
ncbi:MAG: FAD-dependent oxidoreductase [Actinomycetota bacterium]|nr:FAD-dependent oxidoreductase [Actinomycetota bacterium]